MRIKIYKPIQWIEYLIKLCVWFSFIYWVYQIYLSILSGGEAYPVPWYIVLLLMTRVSLIIYIVLLILYHVIKHIRIMNGLPSFKLRYLFNMKRHPYVATLVILCLVIAALSYLIMYAQPILLYHPYHSTVAYDRLMEVGTFETYSIEDEEKGLTYHGFGNVDKDQQLPTIIYFAGNGQTSATEFYYMYLEHRFTYFENYQFIFVDYPGYGLSEGKTSDDAILHMGDVVYDYVYHLDYVDQDEIYIYGYSIGTGVATYIASKHDVKGLILIAPYSSITDIMNSYLPIFKGILTELVVEEFDTISYAKDVDVSPLIIASKTDQTIPFVLSEKLAFSFDELYEFYAIDDTSHGAFMQKEDVLLKIVEYLEQE